MIAAHTLQSSASSSSGTASRLYASSTMQRLGEKRLAALLEAEAIAGGVVTLDRIKVRTCRGEFTEVSIQWTGDADAAEAEVARLFTAVELIVAVVHALDSHLGPSLMAASIKVLRARTSVSMAIQDLTAWIRADQRDRGSDAPACVLSPRESREQDQHHWLMTDRHGLLLTLLSRFDRRGLADPAS